jgi:pyruvate-ferredoxin/flavodoxin oxidoreductase
LTEPFLELLVGLGLFLLGTMIMSVSKSITAMRWNSFNAKFAVKRKIKRLYLDAFQIAREEASDPDLQLRMQGIAFQSALLSTSPVAKETGFSQRRLLEAIRSQLQHKFGSKGVRVVQENMSVVKRGFDEVKPVGNQRTTPAHSTEELRQISFEVESPDF